MGKKYNVDYGRAMNQTHLHPYSRSVSIIGVGCTPFMYTLESEETNGLTEGELFGQAALDAMKDAGVSPQEVEFYYHGQANPMNGSGYLSPNMQVANWFGMKGKGSVHHSEACCTGYMALELAVNAVASGKYDCVLSGCVEFGDAIPEGLDVPQIYRKKFPVEEFFRSTENLSDNCYTREMMGSKISTDDAAVVYQRKYGLTDEEIDSALIAMAAANRKNAVHAPLAVNRVPLDEEAKAAGFPDGLTYLHSPANPRIGGLMRPSGFELKCDGAAAVIVASTEWAEKRNLPHTPIEVLGIGVSDLENNTPHLEWRGTIEAIRQVYELTGVKPEEIDLLYANDFLIPSQLAAAEASGYLPEGEGWKYFIEGRTAYDGDRPINTNGGRTAFGHAHAASGLADIYEAVLQMRGLAGERQVRKLPQTVLLRGFGGGQNLAAVLLRRTASKRSETPFREERKIPEMIVKKYYDALAEGKILGRKCPRCGHIEWPPVYACNKCGCTETEWVEMPEEGVATSVVLPSLRSILPSNQDLMPFALGNFELGGSEADGLLVGIRKEELEELLEKLPLRVRPKIIPREAGGRKFHTVVFERIREQTESGD
ncbi:MAG: hypothetical protein IKF05_01085 [Erysipelotrichaceae bacterium]|nr:hypothetical protein [Erysipelotrichaceae bacterium]